MVEVACDHVGFVVCSKLLDLKKEVSCPVFVGPRDPGVEVDGDDSDLGGGLVGDAEQGGAWIGRSNGRWWWGVGRRDAKGGCGDEDGAWVACAGGVGDS